MHGRRVTTGTTIATGYAAGTDATSIGIDPIGSTGLIGGSIGELIGGSIGTIAGIDEIASIGTIGETGEIATTTVSAVAGRIATTAGNRRETRLERGAKGRLSSLRRPVSVWVSRRRVCGPCPPPRGPQFGSIAEHGKRPAKAPRAPF